MSGYKSVPDKTNNYCSRFVPPKDELNNNFFERIALFNWFMKNGATPQPDHTPYEYQSIWKNCAHEITTIIWLIFRWKTNRRVYEVLGVFVAPEFVNRFGFSSSFAFMINVFKRKYSITHRQHLELLYVALTQSSQLQYVYIMRLMLQINCYSRDANLFHKFREMCETEGLKFSGGPLPRYQPQHTKNITKMDDHTFDEVIMGLEKATKDLEDGLFINVSKKHVIGGVHLSKYNVKCVGEVAGSTFPSICVFTGLCQSEPSIMTAMFARVNDTPTNSGSKNSYLEKMNDYLQLFVDPSLGKYDRSYYDIASYAISKSWYEVQCSIENGFCLRYQSSHKWEAYFRGFDLYIIFPNYPIVHIKRYGHTSWEVMQFPKLV